MSHSNHPVALGSVAFPSESAQYLEIPRPRKNLGSARKTVPHSRSRTPSNRTPLSRRDLHHIPSTPTSSVRPLLPRANSSGPIPLTASNSTGLIGPVPKSAKRWARTAHLHEVKHLAGHRRMNSSNTHATRADRDAENRPPYNPPPSAPVVGVTSLTSASSSREPGPQNIEGDVFSPSAEGSNTSNLSLRRPSISSSSPKKSGLPSHRKQLSSVGSDILLGCVRGTTSFEDSNSDADGWEDTDADASDFDPHNN